jgi:serine/threonine protein phosphatase PrpC
MTQLSDYERTLGDRMMLNMHEQQFASAGAPLEQTQRDSLLQLMKDERLKTPASVFDTTNGGDPSKALSVMRDDAAVDKWIAQEEDYQRRVLQSATQSLNPDQVNALRESFKQQLEMQRFGVKMSKEMFKGSGASGAIIVTPSVTTDAPAK